MVFSKIVILLLFTLNVSAELKKAIIEDVNIVNTNYTRYDYNIIGLDKKIPLKYLLSKNVLFEIKGKNFVGHNYKGTLKIKIGEETDIIDNVIYTKSNESTIYFGTKKIRDFALKSIGKKFEFEFCPYSSSEGYGECGKSDTFYIKEDKYNFNDSYFKYQYYIKDMNIEKAKKNAGGKYIPTIAIIDDGISINHDDLEGNTWTNNKDINGNGIDDDNNGYIDDYYGWNFVDNNSIMFPKGSHGTSVAGVIGSISDNKKGLVGVINKVKLMPLIACSGTGCKNEDINNSIKYAVDNGADIINLSLGGQWYNYDNKNSEAIKYAVDNGVIIIISMGNGDTKLTRKGINTDISKISPVCNEVNKSDIIGVSALSLFSDKTKKGLMPYWTNYGECSDVFAYGEDIPVITSDGQYDITNGTSFSAPIITGVIGLGFNKYGKIDNKSIYKALKNSYNQWHGIDANKYISELGEIIKSKKIIQEQEKVTEKKKEYQKSLKPIIEKIFSKLKSKYKKLSKEKQETIYKKIIKTLEDRKNKFKDEKTLFIFNYFIELINKEIIILTGCDEISKLLGLCE